jgi:hypothetical protein
MHAKVSPVDQCRCFSSTSVFFRTVVPSGNSDELPEGLTAVSTELVTVKARAEAQAGVQLEQGERLKRAEAELAQARAATAAAREEAAQLRGQAEACRCSMPSSCASSRIESLSGRRRRAGRNNSGGRPREVRSRLVGLPGRPLLLMCCLRIIISPGIT